jgi:hypothetical protein
MNSNANTRAKAAKKPRAPGNSRMNFFLGALGFLAILGAGMRV